MNQARVRIGRITPKSDSGTLRLIRPRHHDSHVADRIRQWASDVLSNEAAPNAFIAIAFRVSADRPGALITKVSWDSDTVAIPVMLLPEWGLQALRNELVMTAAKEEVMADLGYMPPDRSS